MSSLRYTVVEPRTESSQHHDAILIFPNEIAASLDDYHYARAQALADFVGIHVLAYERPLSADQRTLNLRQRSNIARNIASQHFATAKQLDKALQTLDPQVVHVGGHSAGAIEAIGITTAEVLPVHNLVVTDPGAIRRSVPGKAEVWDYASYQIWTERHNPHPTPPNAPDYEPKQKPSAKTQLLRSVGEIAAYNIAWRTTMSAQNLMHIASDQPDVAVDLTFPSHTFTASQTCIRALNASLEAARNNIPYAQPFNTHIIQDSYHSYFNNYELFAAVIANGLALDGAGE